MATVNIGRVRPAYKKEWNATDTYAALDFVLYTNDTLYIALKDVPANYEPDSQTEYWAPFGSKGLTGNGIASFVFVEDQDAGKLWKMTFTDGTETDILVPRGSIGPKGNGIVSISFDKALDNGDYQYSIVMDDGQTFSIVAPQGPSFRIVQTPKVEIVGGTSVSKADFVVKITDFASLYNHTFAERVIDIARDDKFSQLVVTATITPDDEDKNTYTVSQLLLDYGTKYFVRARDKNSAGDLSDYSVPVFAVTKMEVREIEKPVISAPSSGGQLATLIPEFTFSAPVWIASTGNIDKMQVIIRLDSATLFDSGWVDLQTDYAVVDFRYDWGTSYSATVQYKESATGLVSPVSNAVGYATRAAYVVAPVITFPSANSRAEAKTIAIQTSAFATVGTEDTHQSTTWMVAGDAEFKNILWELKNSTSNLTSATAAFTTPLPAGQTVYIGAIHNGATLGSSMKSTPLPVVVGTTKKAVVTKPTTGASVYPSTGVAIETGPFSVEVGSDTHKDSSYKICRDADGTDIVVSAMHVADKTLHVFDKPELVEGTHYFAFAMHTGVTYGDGPWSDGVECVASKADFTLNVARAMDLHTNGLYDITCMATTKDEAEGCYYAAFLVTSYTSDGFASMCFAKMTLTGDMVWCKVLASKAYFTSNWYMSLCKLSTHFVLVSVDFIWKISLDGRLLLKLTNPVQLAQFAYGRFFKGVVLPDDTFLYCAGGVLGDSGDSGKSYFSFYFFNADMTVKKLRYFTMALTGNNATVIPFNMCVTKNNIYMAYAEQKAGTASAAYWVVVVKYTLNLDVVWSRKCNQTSKYVLNNSSDYFIQLKVDKDENVFVHFTQQYSSSGLATYYSCFVVIDAAGYLLRSKGYYCSGNYVKDMIVTDDEVVLVSAGSIRSSMGGSYGYWVVRLNKDLTLKAVKAFPVILNGGTGDWTMGGTLYAPTLFVDFVDNNILRLIGPNPCNILFSSYDNTQKILGNQLCTITITIPILESVTARDVATWNMDLPPTARFLRIWGSSDDVFNIDSSTVSPTCVEYTRTSTFVDSTPTLTNNPDSTGGAVLTPANTLFVGAPV